jgi:catechol 2,3-dioxygenase-like lactoylglutathione lyase family enzyme
LKLGHIEVFVADPAASRDWYVQVLGARAVADQGPFQWIELGGTELLLRPGAPRVVPNYRETSVALVLYVDSLAPLETQLAIHQVPVSHGDEDGCLTFQDPDGHWIQATVFE